ncbi:hypothetical protein [Pelagicoccus mobilis]|uniref:Uncharacterized protein n=1 Tax=Pelagicoccus mobilis TaxID=415221 RepID=A0A934RVX5_9BACT|nr:hypothetical protein [Pelagicoccus mobilis]MBK1876435.1 hypothetical protein [Pelagicoccus mobilis]
MAKRQVSSSVSFLSGLSAWSLIVFGGLSLAASLLGHSLGGAIVGVALLLHGGVELHQRGALGSCRNERAPVFLACNQLALAFSVIMYLAWQVLSLDVQEIDAMLAREPIRSLLALYPAELRERLYQNLPAILVGAYAVAGFLVLLGCLGMATVYLRVGRRKS